MTRPARRWVLAALVTVAAFTLSTWVCGAFVLPMRDGAVRWGIAGGLGVAVAALAALWGASYATAEQEHEQPAAETAQAAPVGNGRTTNKITGGTFHGPVTQGRDIGILNLDGPAEVEAPESPLPAVDDPPAEG
jgi:hypothetical protein